MMTIRDHLVSRGLDLTAYDVIIDDVKQLATFLIWNLTGQLVGFQQYNPLGTKSIRNDESVRDQLKYFTFVGIEGDRGSDRKRVAVWGLETLCRSGPVFLTEGIFDAVKLHNIGCAALAALSNDPKHLGSFLQALGRETIAVCDNDPPGRRLARSCHRFLVVPDPYHDLGDMEQHEVERWLQIASTSQ